MNVNVNIDNYSELGERYEAAGSCEINGKKIEYDTVCEDVVFESEHTPVASMFSYSYIAKNEGENRPVLFVFNGGPGAASIQLHIGFLGPQRVKYPDAVRPSINPPYEVEDNPNFLLDQCDLVFIDPVGTGYSRIWDPEKASEIFWSVDGDAHSMVLFIENWLSKYGRWNSSKFLCGESYGTIRACAVSDAAMISNNTLRAVSFNGIILHSSILNLQPFFGPVPREYSVVNFTAMAATNWYHNSVGKGSLCDFVAKAEKFANGEYASALALGVDSLEKSRRQGLLENLEYYTGVSKDFFEKNDYRIEIWQYKEEVLAKKGMDVGLYDGRYTLMKTPNMGQRDLGDVADDPCMAQYTPSYVAVWHDYFVKKLNIDPLRPVNLIQFLGDERFWNYKTDSQPAQSIAAAMRRNPEMRLLVGAGYYDLCTTPGNAKFVFETSGVPKDRLTFKEYESGHMLFVGDEPAKKAADDIREFLGGGSH